MRPSPPHASKIGVAFATMSAGVPPGSTVATTGVVSEKTPSRSDPPMTPALRLTVVLALLATPAGAATRPAVEASRGMVVSANARATEVGVKILEAGGNAIDAAVAVGYALAVVDPCCGNIGGGGFMTVRLADGRELFLDFRETAPAAASRDMYLDEAGNPLKDESLYGWRASGVPGTVAGFDHALAKWGTLPRTKVMAPAIALARDGFVLARPDTDILERGTARLAKDPEAARIFLDAEGRARKPGDRLVQEDLAKTLEKVATRGPDAFYRGEIAAAVETAMKARRGTLTAADFAAYRVNEATPVSCTYRGHRLISAPPPSSGEQERLRRMGGSHVGGKHSPQQPPGPRAG